MGEGREVSKVVASCFLLKWDQFILHKKRCLQVSGEWSYFCSCKHMREMYDIKRDVADHKV